MTSIRNHGFTPTRTQHRAKARFHVAVAKNPMLTDLEQISRPKLSRLAGVKDVSLWCKNVEFLPWFLNKDYNRELLESGVQPAIERAIAIIKAPSDGEKGSPKPSDQLKATQMLLDYAGYGPKHNKPKDDVDAPMTDEEAEKVINERMKRIGKLEAVEG